MDRVAALLLALESIGLVDVDRALKPGNPGPVNIANSEIGVQGLLENEGLGGIVASLQLHFQLLAYRHAEAQVEDIVAEAASDLVGLEYERDLDVSILVKSGRLNGPFQRQRKP